MHHRFDITQDQRYFRIFGARRCGNHALIDFIAQNIGGEAILLNNCQIVGHPFFSCQSFERNGQIYTRNDTHGGAAIKLESAAFMAELSRSYAGVETVFAFFEEQLTPDPVENNERLKLGIFADRSTDIITTRNFLNWLASAIKQYENYNPHLDPNWLTADLISHYSRLISHWLIHAKAAEQATYTPHVMQYEDFITSQSHRQAFLNGLNVPPAHLDIPRHHASSDTKQKTAMCGSGALAHLFWRQGAGAAVFGCDQLGAQGVLGGAVLIAWHDLSPKEARSMPQIGPMV